MKSKIKVILIWALMCCIPAFFYIFFRDKTEDTAPRYSRPEASMVWPVVGDDGHYGVSITPVDVPLKTGKQQVNLDIEALKQGDAIKQPPVVKVLMPMGKQSMEAPATLKQLSSGHYQVHTQFAMGGNWEMQVQPVASGEPILLDFRVAP